MDRVYTHTHTHTHRERERERDSPGSQGGNAGLVNPVDQERKRKKMT